MLGRVAVALVGAMALVAGALHYLLRRAVLRFEVFYDRPQGEAEVFRFEVRLPPLLHFQLRRQPSPPREPLEGRRSRDWSRVLSEGWTAVREIQVVHRTVVSLLRHQLAFVTADPSLSRSARFGLGVLERLPWVTEELSWVTRLGTGDAAATGFLCGALWAVKGAAFGFLAERMAFRQPPVVRVLPDFANVAFRTTFRCIVRVRVGDIIRTSVSEWRRKRGVSWRTNTRLRA